MEPPSSLDPEAIRDEKVKALKAIRPLDLEGDDTDVVRARYRAGLVNGDKAIGYLEEEGIPEDSITETFAALRRSLDNWRWKGVPFYLRSGKRMARKVSEVAVLFRRPPAILFSEGDRFNVSPNCLVLRIQPDEGVTLTLNSKTPGIETRLQPVELSFGYETTFQSNTPEAYERLILDAEPLGGLRDEGGQRRGAIARGVAIGQENGAPLGHFVVKGAAHAAEAEHGGAVGGHVLVSR